MCDTVIIFIGSNKQAERCSLYQESLFSVLVAGAPYISLDRRTILLRQVR